MFVDGLYSLHSFVLQWGRVDLFSNRSVDFPKILLFLGLLYFPIALGCLFILSLLQGYKSCLDVFGSDSLPEQIGLLGLPVHIGGFRDLQKIQCLPNLFGGILLLEAFTCDFFDDVCLL